MIPDDITEWSNALGPTFVAVVILALLVIPMVRRDKKEDHDLPAAVQVWMARMEMRIDALEKKMKD